VSLLNTPYDKRQNHRRHDLQHAAARCVSTLAAQLTSAGLSEVTLSVIANTSIDVLYVRLLMSARAGLATKFSN
jgi:hypothetical protein